MILQTIIENAVKYGLEPVNRPGLLSILSKERDGNLMIIVEDNGVGMDEDTLLSLSHSLSHSAALEIEQAELADAHSGRGGIGLENVQRRLREHSYRHDEDIIRSGIERTIRRSFPELRVRLSSLLEERRCFA